MYFTQNDLVDTMANIVRLNRNPTKVMQSKQPKHPKQFTTSDHNNNENSSSSISTNNNNDKHMNSNNNNSNNGDMFANEQSLRPQSIKNHNDIERNENELQQRKKFSTPRWSSISSSVQTQQINNCHEYAVKVNIMYRRIRIYMYERIPSKVYRAMDFLT